MLRSLVNRIMGRKKVVDESLSFEEVLNMFDSLDSSVEIDLDYCRELSREQVTWINESPVYVLAFLKSQFSKPEERPLTRHQVFKGKLAEKHYLDLRSFSQRASLNYLI